jgi:hypothetical protein
VHTNAERKQTRRDTERDATVTVKRNAGRLRHAAGVLRSTRFFGRLFGRDWRAAKAIWRQTFPDERKLAPLEAARRLMASALWKDRLQKIEASTQARTAAGPTLERRRHALRQANQGCRMDAIDTPRNAA